jgi:hypothetical protein
MEKQRLSELPRIKTFMQLQKAKLKNQIAGNMIKLHAIDLQYDRIKECQVRQIAELKSKLK